jgi:hypothetical protein
MARQFKKHYTVAEARALLPEVRGRLKQLADFRQQLEALDEVLRAQNSAGQDLGGPQVNRWLAAVVAIQQAVLWFHNAEIQIKDLGRGLIDFPAIIGGREVFLCWEQDDEDIEFWHDLDSGYAGRERL